MLGNLIINRKNRDRELVGVSASIGRMKIGVRFLISKQNKGQRSATYACRTSGRMRDWYCVA